MTRRAQLMTSFLLAATALFAGLAGCSKPTTPLGANQPPVTRIFLSGPVDTVAYTVRMHWSGDDPDGDVRYFEIQFQPGDSPFIDADWDSTSRVDSVFALPIPHDVSTFTFWVRAVDNLGLRDPHPQSVVLHLRNRAPHVEFINLPHRTHGGDYHFLPVLTLQWVGTDPDGNRTIAQYHVWLDGPDGTTFDTLVTKADTVFTLRLENFGDVSTPKMRTVHVSVIDEANAIGDTATYTWLVDPYVVGSTRVLLVDEYNEGATLNNATPMDSLYRNAVSDFTGDRYTLYDVFDMSNFRFAKDADELLRHFDYVVWYDEGAGIPVNLGTAGSALQNLLDSGGRLFLSSLSVVVLYHILSAQQDDPVRQPGRGAAPDARGAGGVAFAPLPSLRGEIARRSAGTSSFLTPHANAS